MQHLCKILHIAFSHLTIFLSFPEEAILSHLYLRKVFKTLKKKELRDPMKNLIDSISKNNRKLIDVRKDIEFEKKPHLINPFARKYIPSKNKG